MYDTKHVMSRSNIKKLIRDFFNSNPDIIDAYLEVYSAPDINLLEPAIRKHLAANPGGTVASVLRTAFARTMTTGNDLGTSIENITTGYLESPPNDAIQAYFREVNKVYKDISTYDIQYIPENRDALIRANLKTVIAIARQHQGLGLSLGELISAGNLGLCTAWDHFDVSRTTLGDDVLKAIETLDEECEFDDIRVVIDRYISYGKMRDSWNRTFGPDQKNYKERFVRWAKKNVHNAKFSSVAVMWISSFIFSEIDNFSRIVRKPKTEIYKDKSETGSYKREIVVGLTNEDTEDNDTSFADSILPATQPDPYPEDNRKEILDKVFHGISTADRELICKKFGIGYPHEMSNKDLSRTEGRSTSSITQTINNLLPQLKENCDRYGISVNDLS